MDVDALWEMERRFWLDGPQFYERSMAAGALMVFPRPAGILKGNDIIEGLRQGPRWTSVSFGETTAATAGGTAVLAYRATGIRAGQQPYEALCCSTYVCEGGEWRLFAHQQTPDSG